MTEHTDRAHAFADGEMTSREAEAFREHLGICSACQRELHSLLQLDSQLVEVTPAIEVKPKKRFWVLIALAAALPLCGIAIALALRARGPSEAAPLQLAELSTRSFEGRLAYRGADRYRPYDVARAESSSKEVVPLKVLAELEQRGDFRGLAAGYLLMGQLDQASRYLDRVPSGPGVDVDRAAVLYGERRYEPALALLDAALQRKTEPRGSALWNRGLILRDLGLPLRAAADFEQVSALGEAGWSQEAEARARVLRQEVEARKRAWYASYQAGFALIDEGVLLPEATLRGHPGLARNFFYDAVWTAPSRERLLTLLPLAERMDGLSGGRVLQEYLERTARVDFVQRSHFAAELRKIIPDDRKSAGGDGRLDREGQDHLLETLRRAGQRDQLLGALMYLNRVSDHLAEFRTLALEMQDPWWRFLAEQKTAEVAADNGELLDAEQRLLPALAQCWQSHVDYACAWLERQLVWVYTDLHRTVEATAHATTGWRWARNSGDWKWELRFLLMLGNVSGYRVELPLVRAYLEEALLQGPEMCRVQRLAHETLAMNYLYELQAPEAFREISQTPRCGEAISVRVAYVLSDLARLGVAEAATRLKADLPGLRSSGLSPGNQIVVDYIEGALTLLDNPARGRELLRRAIAAARGRPAWDSDARKGAALSYQALAFDAASTRDYAGALGFLASELDLQTPDRCSLGVAIHDERSLVVAKDSNGKFAGHYTTDRKSMQFDASTLIPSKILQELRPCEHIAVIARPPVHGHARLFPADQAWSYRSASDRDQSKALPPRRLVVANVEPPALLNLPKLQPILPSTAPETLFLSGPLATPSRVLREMRDATEIELHAHGLVNLGVSDASLIALSAEGSGDRYSLSAGEVRQCHLQGKPLVILAACQAAQTGFRVHQAWSLPMAFIEAGARAVLASPAKIDDADAQPFFSAFRQRNQQGMPVAQALRDTRVEWLSRNQNSWVQELVLFE